MSDASTAAEDNRIDGADRGRFGERSLDTATMLCLKGWVTLSPEKPAASAAVDYFLEGIVRQAHGRRNRGGA